MSDETPDKSVTPDNTAPDDESTAETPTPSARPSKPPAAPVDPIAEAVESFDAVISADKNADEKSAGDKGVPGAAKSSADAAKPRQRRDPALTYPAPKFGAPKDSATDRSSAATSASARPHKPVQRAGADRTGPEAASPAPRPLTAGEYARTTKPSPSTTAVIPAVRDDRSQPSPSVTQAAAAANPGGRQASLKLVRIDPWTVTKVTFALTVALMIVAVVATTILWVVLSIAGVWDQINASVATVLSDDSGSFDITEYLGFWRIVGLALVLSAINVVITTAVATIGAYLYNLAAQLLGGVDVTLAEED